ncbi:MAG: phage tail sheath subtilisin-like domain-containing protein [Bacteroidales bacterium]|nr:phage tail sheath subtilisin-like domain-containing protein [Bacteroidales bacterium]
MPEYLSPAVYVEEVSSGIKPIEGVGTSTGAFIGIAEKGPIAGADYGKDGPGKPMLITSFGDFNRIFGGFINGEFLAYAVQQFFMEGGTRCYVARTAHFNDPSVPGSLTATKSLTTLVDVNSNNILEVSSINEGEWGDNINIEIESSSKYSTILNGGLSTGATEATLLSSEGIEVGSILELVAPSASTTIISRVVITRLAGKRVFFEDGLVPDVNIPDKAIVTASDFTLKVKYGDRYVETFENLSMENTNITDYVENRINNGSAKSKYIRVRDLLGTASNEAPVPTLTPQFLTQGSDGNPDDAFDFLGNEDAKTGFYAFDSIDDINIMAAPGITIRDVFLAGMTYCENRKDCFFVGDVAQGEDTAKKALDFKNGTGNYAGKQALNSKYGALYWPWVRIADPLSKQQKAMPPSGAIIGSYSATDIRRGVHKAPAGIDDGFLNSVVGIEKIVTKGEHDLLNPKGINVIRTFPGLGILIWGARTTSSDPEWKYINVRRLFLFLEESIHKGTQWVVFEPNDRSLWKNIARNIRAFLRIQWLEGKLVGNTEEQAFYVKCDEETNPQESIDLGRVITEIGVAPSKPAEFVIFRIAQWDGGASVSE